MWRDDTYLVDILESAKIALGYVSGKTWDAFYGDIQCQDAVVRRIEIIGEAARRVSQETRDKHLQIPWREMTSMPKASNKNTRARLSSLIKSARDIMRKDAGLNGDLDRLPQLSWILFLKTYDDLEQRRDADAVLGRQAYKPVIPRPYRWRAWATDENEGATGEELLKFVNDELLPALRELLGTDEKLKVAEVFKETYNRMLSGYLLRDVVNLVNGIH